MEKDQTFGTGLNKKEIESHSSALFNRRIDFLVMNVNNAEMDCTTATIPTVQVSLAYYSSLLTLFMETSKMYDSNEDTKKAIEQCVKKGMRLSAYVRSKNAKQIGVEILIKNCLQWRYLMQTAMHNLNYFLRMSFQEPKGISQILELFGQEDTNEIPGYNEQLRDQSQEES